MKTNTILLSAYEISEKLAAFQQLRQRLVKVQESYALAVRNYLGTAPDAADPVEIKELQDCWDSIQNLRQTGDNLAKELAKIQTELRGAKIPEVTLEHMLAMPERWVGSTLLADICTTRPEEIQVLEQTQFKRELEAYNNAGRLVLDESTVARHLTSLLTIGRSVSLLQDLAHGLRKRLGDNFEKLPKRFVVGNLVWTIDAPVDPKNDDFNITYIECTRLS